MGFLKLATFSRKFHRLCVSLIVIFGVVMMVTGTMMKFGLDTTGSARLLHNLLSPVFAFIFVIMMLTGLVMYIQPWVIKRIRNLQNPPPPTV